jgi:hypothetical protein
VLFGDPTYFITDYPSSTCLTCIDSEYAWNHGDVQMEIGSTWWGMAGPGVRHLGQTAVWTDHTDLRPTILQLVGLTDTYESDGRVILEALDAYAPTLAAGRATLEQLGAAYKQINAPFGSFCQNTLLASTRAITGDDGTYSTIESQIATLTTQRDALAAQIRSALDGAEFHRRPVSATQAAAWIKQAQSLLSQASDLAGQQ